MSDLDTTSTRRSLPNWALAIGVAFIFTVIYTSTAVWTESDVNVDAVAAALPAWSLAEHGTIALPDGALVNPWVVAGPNGNFSNRPPGTFLVAWPAYLLAGGPTFSSAPATATAVLMTALALAVLFLTFTKMMNLVPALVSIAVFGLGTATWPISSAQLWPHGIGQLTAAIAILGLATQRYLVSGLAFGAGILIRPPTALFPAITGVGVSLTSPHGRLRPLLSIGIPSAAGVAALMLYNLAAFGEFGISGGYSSAFVDNLTTMPWSEFASNVVAMFAGPRNGLFVWSPVILVSLVALPVVWKEAPSWSRTAFIAGVAYLVVHARLNRASGGLAFNYRYPLEPLVMMAPLVGVAALELFRRSSLARLMVTAGAVLSILLQALYVFTLTCEPLGADDTLCSLGV